MDIGNLGWLMIVGERVERQRTSLKFIERYRGRHFVGPWPEAARVTPNCLWTDCLLSFCRRKELSASATACRRYCLLLSGTRQQMSGLLFPVLF